MRGTGGLAARLAERLRRWRYGGGHGMDTPFITREEGRFGGRPFIAGTRISVDDIAASYGFALDHLIIAELRTNWFPDLTDDQIRAAIAYWREHPREIAQNLEQDLEAERAHWRTSG